MSAVSANNRLRRDAVITLAALLAVVAWDASGLDLWLTAQYGSSAGFGWRHHWLTERVLHDGGRWLAQVAVLGFALTLFRAGAARPGLALRRYWFAVTAACLLLVPALKRQSATTCPWHLANFGGSVPYVPHWLFGHSDGGPGHCFPSGHAVSAFAFFGLYFLLRNDHPRAARVVLGVVLAAGALFSWAQLVRGAHFGSHSLWSAWLCWALCVAAAALTQTGRPVPARIAVEAPTDLAV